MPTLSQHTKPNESKEQLTIQTTIETQGRTHSYENSSQPIIKLNGLQLAEEIIMLQKKNLWIYVLKDL